MIVLAFLINIVSLILSFCIIRYELLKKFSIMLWMALNLLFFVKIPLFVDSLLGLFLTEQQLIDLLMQYNLNPINDFNALSFNTIANASLFAFLFDVIMFLFFYLLVKPLRYEKLAVAKYEFFNARYYIIFAYLGLICFALNYGLSFANAGLDFRGSQLGRQDIFYKIILILYLFFNSAAAAGSWLMLRDKKWLQFIILAAPYIIIMILTLSKSLIFAFVGMTLLFLISKITLLFQAHSGIVKKIVMVLVLFITILVGLRFVVGIRHNSTEYLYYPLWRDLSVQDLYYTFYDQQVSTEGQGSLVLWSYFYPLNRKEFHGELNEPSTLLANVRFRAGWGNLHPTLYGWFFIDMKWFGVFMAIWLALILALCEYLRYGLSSYKMGTMVLAFECGFVSIAARGALAYAFTTTVYSFILLAIILLFFKLFNFSWNAQNETAS